MAGIVNDWRSFLRHSAVKMIKSTTRRISTPWSTFETNFFTTWQHCLTMFSFSSTKSLRASGAQCSMIFKKEETEVASSGKVACVTEEFAKARVGLSSDIFEKKPVPKLEPKSASFRHLYMKWPNPDPTQIGVSIGLNHPRIKSDLQNYRNSMPVWYC